MSKKIIIKSFVVLSFVCQLAKAQDFHFSQYSEAGSAINPALAGVQYDTKLTANYKTQWGSVAKSYQTYGVSYEQAIAHKKLKKQYLALAVNIFRDQSGDAKLSVLNPNIGMSYLRKLNKTVKGSIGFQTGFNYKTIDVNSLRWDKQFDGYTYDCNLPTGETTPRSSLTSFDFGTGVNINYAKNDKLFISAKEGNKFNAGFAAYHFGYNKYSFIVSTEKLYARYCLYANGDFNIPGSKHSVMPSFLYMRQGPSSEFVIGALYKFILLDQSLMTGIKKPSAIAIGGQYRYKDAVIPCILLQYDKYAFGVSYDINVSALTPASKRYGGLEIMLRYNVSPGYGRNLGRGDTKPSY
jgi:type IX secretion system PorP/SprF family membrane protein